MTIHDLSDMQRYLVEEEAEKWQEGAITRREFIHRVTLLMGGATAAGGVLLSLGCDVNAPESAPTPTATAPGAAIISPTAAPTTAQATPGGSASPYHVDENDPVIHAEMVDIPQPYDPFLKLKGYLAFNQVRMSPAK